MTKPFPARAAPFAATYIEAAPGCFEIRGLKRHAGAWFLCALGVGAVISGHFLGWTLGLAAGSWGRMLIAAVVLAALFLALSFFTAEMSTALPRNGGPYPFARFAPGPFWRFVSGLCEHVLIPAVICYFIGAFLRAIFGPSVPEPVWWIGTYGAFLALNTRGVELTFRITPIVTLTSLAVLLCFCAIALPMVDVGRWALNSAPDGSELLGGHGAFLTMGWAGLLTALPFAVWLYLAIEETPLAAEGSVDPVRDMPKGILLALATLIVFLNPAVAGIGAHALAETGAPVMDGFRVLFGGTGADILGLIALSGLVAGFHAILFAQGRQNFALSRAGYLPSRLSLTQGARKTPAVAMLAGSGLGLAVMLALWATLGAAEAGERIGSVLLNMAVFAAMVFHLTRAGSFLALRRDDPDLPRPFHGPLGRFGGWLTIGICLLTLVSQVQDRAFLLGTVWVAVWTGLGLGSCDGVARHRLILTPAEAHACTAATDRVAG